MRLLAPPRLGWNAQVMNGDDERALQMSGVIPPLFRASTQDDESVAQMVALLDAQDALPATKRLHDWAIVTAAVRPGDQVIDLGSGTGTLSSELAGLVTPRASTDGPMGWVTGVEPNARFAGSRSESSGKQRHTKRFVHPWTRRSAAVRGLERRSRLVRARTATPQRSASGDR